jgi:group II intron reverse transcriptase/maturase
MFESRTERKCHSLIDKVYGRTNLARAWKKVKENKGSAGIDGMAIEVFEARQDALLDLLHQKLRDDGYVPKPVKRVTIGKSDGGSRKLGIPSVMDRVVQQALVQRMEPIFEPTFADSSFGYRPGRSPHMAMRRVWRDINAGNMWIVDADLRKFFDTIDQEKLVDLIAEKISDGRILRLVRTILAAGVVEGECWEPSLTGMPQGAVASPIWSNIYLTPFDRVMEERGYRLTRWADDFVIACRTRKEAEAALAFAQTFLKERLGVDLHSGKTRIVHVNHGFEFLGYKVKRGKGLRIAAKRRSAPTNPQNLYAMPRGKSVRQFRDQIRSLTRRKAPVTLREMIEAINPIIRGWGNYFKKANVRVLFRQLDGWIERRLWSFLAKRWRNSKWRAYPSSRLINDYDLVRLIHLVPSLQGRIPPRMGRRRKAACGKTARAV